MIPANMGGPLGSEPLAALSEDPHSRVTGLSPFLGTSFPINGDMLPGSWAVLKPCPCTSSSSSFIPVGVLHVEVPELDHVDGWVESDNPIPGSCTVPLT